MPLSGRCRRAGSSDSDAREPLFRSEAVQAAARRPHQKVLGWRLAGAAPPPIASAATAPDAVKPCRCHRMSGPLRIHPEIDCHCTDQPWASSLAPLGPRSRRCTPGAAPFPARSGAGSDLTSNERFMYRSWRREPGALRHGAPLLPGARYEGWGRGGLCRGAKRRTPLELFQCRHRSFSAHEACAMLPRMLPQPCRRRSES